MMLPGGLTPCLVLSYPLLGMCWRRHLRTRHGRLEWLYVCAQLAYTSLIQSIGFVLVAFFAEIQTENPRQTFRAIFGRMEVK
ncbi:uncharacterized protein BDV14DRAFT_164842 [Aspergillus stella-maris]|uniref:uncharacterized protein n=1 Tax=Aspergillus stella-maris TaxID=1810926 RepID=UPI003CCD4731